MYAKGSTSAIWLKSDARCWEKNLELAQDERRRGRETRLMMMLRFLGPGFLDHGRHRGISFGEFLDGQCFDLVLGGIQVAGRNLQGLLDAFQGLDGLVDAIDGLVVFLLGVNDILAEGIPEGDELILKLGEVHRLVACCN